SLISKGWMDSVHKEVRVSVLLGVSEGVATERFDHQLLHAAQLVKQISDPQSSVNGCPYFRACPGCHTLLTHNGEGCPNIICPDCDEEFCFRCLQQECFANEYYVNDYDEDYDSDDAEAKPCVVVDNAETLKHLGL
ncbi:hypothetical protein M9458_011436, partial [Cirrhinus mrigala]